MNLKELAEWTRDLEYPGMSLENAQANADMRGYKLQQELYNLEDRRVALEFEISQTKQDLFEANRANELFKNALAEELINALEKEAI